MQFHPPVNTRLHWNYFLALEKDIETLSRYIEFCPDNMKTYSIELAHLLLSAASEVDTVAKCVCNILDPTEKPDNIKAYRRIITKGEDAEVDKIAVLNQMAGVKKASPDKYQKYGHRLRDLKVHISRYALEFTPWQEWGKGTHPDWWVSYNDVKHERNRHFNKATLNNAVNALAGLLAINYVHCRLELTRSKPEFRYQTKRQNVTCHMEPQSTFLRFDGIFYYGLLAVPPYQDAYTLPDEA